jgi:addiction module HigA family antidote
MPERDLPPIHPGEQLREEFMKPMQLSAYRVARDIDVPTSRVQAIVDEKRAITGDTALRLARYFGTSVPFPKFQSLCPEDVGTSETIRTLAKLSILVVLYVFEIPKIAGGKVIGISKTHH